MESEWTVGFCLRWSRQAGPRERSICPRFAGQHGDKQRERSKNYVENQEDSGNELRAMNEGWRAETSQWGKRTRAEMLKLFMKLTGRKWDGPA